MGLKYQSVRWGVILNLVLKCERPFVDFSSLSYKVNASQHVHFCFLQFFLQELFQIAISRYIENPEKKDLLLQLLQWMPGQGYAVDSSTRNLILKNSHLFGRQLIAEILSRQQMMSKALKSH